jgi:hypothetical protein
MSMCRALALRREPRPSATLDNANAAAALLVARTRHTGLSFWSFLATVAVVAGPGLE